MKKLLLITVAVFFIQVCNSQEIKGPYFGQTPPDRTPQLFAPGIISLTNYSEIRVAFSPDGKECFFTRSSANNSSPWYLYYTKCVDSIWTTPAVASFQPNNTSFTGQPFFSADGNRLYYTHDSHIWIVQRTSQGWDSARILASPINVENSSTVYYSETLDGTAYFASDRPGGKGLLDIWRTRQEEGQPTKVENLGNFFNTSDYEYDPYIEPNGKYLLFARSNAGITYVSYNNGKGGWKVPLNMNTIIPGFNPDDGYADGPSISPDGKFLFWRKYTGGQAEIYWVSATYMDSTKNINFPPYVNRTIPNQKAKQDSLFTYQLPDSTFIDDDGNNTLTYSAIMSNGKPLPLWLNFNTETKTFSGTPDTTGTFVIKVIATDTAKASASFIFNINISPVTSVKQIEEKGIQVFPNPTTGKFTLKLSNVSYLKGEIEIFDLTGKPILSFTIYNKKMKTIDLSGYPKGVYMVKVNVDEDIIIHKIYLE